MTSEIRLIQEIEKHECLYNNSIPEYNRKERSDEAWAKVSHSTELTVPECKDKWRNIRCALLRSLKPSEKTKKPYYLAQYLHFVVPFMKSLNNIDYKEQMQNATAKTRDDSDFLVCTIKTEDETEDVADTNASVSEGDTHYVPFLDPIQATPPIRKRRLNSVPLNRKFKRFKPKRTTEERPFNPLINVPKSNSESMKYFLMSLLPEFETMTEEQSRVFKIKVMMLVDDIKTNFQQIKQNIPSPSESDRLQKRLINLLLKNLQKTS